MAIPEKLAQVLSWSLKSGKHDPDDIESGSACVMEAACFVAGLPLTDSPSCTCPVIASFLRSLNDSLPNDSERDRLLKPLIAEIIGTKSTQAIEERRSYMALDWLIRVHTPAWLDRVESLKSFAADLRNHEEIADLAGATAAWAAARAAAGAAARAAALDAALDAAWDAARDAARAAARDAAGASLKTTVDELQISALALIRRMIEIQS